jgi:hypothetical protein
MIVFASSPSEEDMAGTRFAASVQSPSQYEETVMPDDSKQSSRPNELVDHDQRNDANKERLKKAIDAVLEHHAGKVPHLGERKGPKRAEPH